MYLSDWFQHQLEASAEGFIWAVRQVPKDRQFVRPPLPLGEWPAARHALHLLYYERHVALPSMRQWLGGTGPARPSLSEEAAWRGSTDLDKLLENFREVRREQIELLARYDDSAWDEVRDALWGPVALRWVVTKTYQHTAEHTHDVLSMALFWDMFTSRTRLNKNVS